MTPCWNQQIVFTMKFPLPTHPMVVQIREDEIMMNNVIGTAVIHLDKISNSDSGGNGNNTAFYERFSFNARICFMF